MSVSASQPSHARGRLVIALGLLALAAALVGAFAPAERVHSTYRWPPTDLPAERPSRTWYAPLLLARQQAESIAVTTPCTASPTIVPGRSRARIVSTTRLPRNDGLTVEQVDDELVVRLGTEEVARARLAPQGQPPGEDCRYELRIDGSAWSLEGGPDAIRLGGTLAAPPRVNGLFSDVDISAPTAPSIELTTFAHRLQSTPLQWVSRLLAGLLALTALALVAATDWRPRRPSLRSTPRRLVPADLVVGLILLGWWILSPAFADDGWVFVRQSSFSSSGGFTNYYNGFGANLPNGYWLEWTQHWLVDATSALVLLRVPSLLLLAGIWVLCRWTLARLDEDAPPSPAVLWALAAAFTVQALAWGMTIRPEPATAFLVSVVLAAIVQFLRTGSSAPVALAVLAAPFAVTGHHAGVVALAPLVVAIAPLVGWARSRPAFAISAVMSSSALFLTLLLVGTDLEQWRDDVTTSRVAGSSGEIWLDELNRYGRLSQDLYGTPLRRASVALMGLAVLAYLLRRRRNDGRLWDLPGACLAVGLLLLVVTPSKWPWHFGALMGMAAVAVAAETARFRRESDDARRWSAWPFLAVVATCVAAEWAWHVQARWNTLDLRTPPWFANFHSGATVSKTSVLLPFVFFVCAGLWQIVRRRARSAAWSWRAASWMPVAFAVPLAAFTITALVRDAAGTDAWTLPRQNLSVLAGRDECGLADDLLRPVRTDRTTLVMTDLVMYLPCAHLPELEDGAVIPPDHLVTSDIWDGGIGYGTSPFDGIYDLYDVRQVPLAETPKPTSSIVLYRVAAPMPGGVEAPPDVADG